MKREKELKKGEGGTTGVALKRGTVSSGRGERERDYVEWRQWPLCETPGVASFGSLVD